MFSALTEMAFLSDGTLRYSICLSQNHDLYRRVPGGAAGESVALAVEWAVNVLLKDNPLKNDFVKDDFVNDNLQFRVRNRVFCDDNQ